MQSKKIKSYSYYNLLDEHMSGRPFFDDLVLPRQLEIHLPGDGKRACNARCKHCQGRFFKKGLGKWEEIGLELLHNLAGSIPYQIYGGAYTEPLLNQFLPQYLRVTKQYHNHFGIHTNGIELFRLQQESGFLDLLCELGEDSIDYLSISLDGGERVSWGETKGVSPDLFDGIVKAMEIVGKLPHKFAFRVCYLMTEENTSIEAISNIVSICKQNRVDSLRFSIPYDNYNKDFELLKQYNADVEEPLDTKFGMLVAPFLSNSEGCTHIFYVSPKETCVWNYNFTQCIYPYYQITLGADGYMYRCSSTAAPNGKVTRLIPITADLQDFCNAVKMAQDPNWKAQTCFKNRLRCNRMAIEINQEYKRMTNGQ